MLITQNSLKNMELSIENLKQQLKEIRKNKALAIEEGVGDGWHDNFAFEQATMQENMIIQRIINLEKTISEAEIMNEDALHGNFVTVGSKVKIRICDSDGNSKELALQIVDVKGEGKLREATLNSPIGQAILYKKVGEIGEYVLDDGREFEVEVLNIDNN